MKISPPNLYKLFILLMLFSLFLPIPNQITFPYNLLGILLLVFGSYMAIKTKKLFKRTDTPIHSTANPMKLHTEGFFRLTRNPMYLGISIGLAGIAIITGLIYNLILAVLYLLIMDLFFIRHEENKLEKIFGDQFGKYKKQTRRWI